MEVNKELPESSKARKAALQELEELGKTFESYFWGFQRFGADAGFNKSQWLELLDYVEEAYFELASAEADELEAEE